MPRTSKENGRRDQPIGWPYTRRGPYARVSCEACRRKKAKCNLSQDVIQSRDPRESEERCDRCKRMNLFCIVWREGASGTVASKTASPSREQSIVPDSHSLRSSQPPPSVAVAQETVKQITVDGDAELFDTTRLFFRPNESNNQPVGERSLHHSGYDHLAIYCSRQKAFASRVDDVPLLPMTFSLIRDIDQELSRKLEQRFVSPSTSPVRKN